jgi:hypothetical protein
LDASADVTERIFATSESAWVGPTSCTKPLADNRVTVSRLMARNQHLERRVANVFRAIFSVVLAR